MNNKLKNSRVVLVVDDRAYQALEASHNAYDFFQREDLAIVRYRGDGDDEVADTLVKQNLLRPGAILVQSPYNLRQYAETDEAERRFAIDKYHSFLTFAAALGASSVVLDRVDTDESKRTTGGNVGGTHPAGANAKVSAESDEARKFRSGVRLEYNGTAGAPDFAAAERVLDEKRLWGDPTMSALLDIRRLTNVAAKEFKLDLDVSSETRANLAAAASLSVPGLKDAFGASFKFSSVRTVGFTMKLRVTF